MSIQVGDKAPDFSLVTLTADGPQVVTLSEITGESNLLLLFVPMAFTGVCTTELCDVSNGISEYEGLGAQLSGYVEGTPEYNTQALQVQMKEYEIKATMELMDLELKRKYSDLQLSLGAEIRAAVKAFSEARGLKMVFRSIEVDPTDPRQVQVEEMKLRSAVYYDPVLDITDDVIQFLKTWK